MNTELYVLPVSLGALAELQEIQEVLFSDVKACTETLSMQSSAFGRRAYVRAMFAYVEGTIFSLKQVALIDADEAGINLTRAELSFLLEESYQLTDTGKAEARHNYGVRLAPNIRFVFNLVARIYNLAYELKVNDSGWSSFREALEIRNRLTHPKTAADTVVSHNDFLLASQAFIWFQRNYTVLILSIIERLRSKICEAD